NARFAISVRDLDAGAAPLPERSVRPVRAAQTRSGAGTRLAVARAADGCRQIRGGVAVAENSSSGDHGHVPVLLERCVELLTPALTRRHPGGSGATLLDATLGAGGHAERFLTDLPGLRLIGLDRDPSALDIARSRLARFADRVTLVHTRYDGIAAALAESGYAAAESVDAMLFDLGVSSMQLD